MTSVASFPLHRRMQAVVADARRIDESDLSFVRNGQWFEHPLLPGESAQWKAASYAGEFFLFRRANGHEAAFELFDRMFATMAATEDGCWDTECGYWFVQMVVPIRREGGGR